MNQPRKPKMRNDSEVRSPAPSPWLSTLSRYTAWVVAGIPFLVHLIWGIRNSLHGAHQNIAPFGDLAGEELSVWANTFVQLFVRPGTGLQAVHLYTFWLLALLALSIYGALRAESDIAHGVLLFISHTLAGAIMLAVVTPAIWILFGGAGPLASEFVPPILLFMIAVFLGRDSGERPEFE